MAKPAMADTTDGHGNTPLAVHADSDARTLVAVDGSELLLQRIDGGLIRQIATPGGVTAKATFRFSQARFGTVAESTGVAGLFVMNGTSIATEYGDGRSELLVGDAGQAVSVVRKTADGVVSCITWYPAGHRFSVQERRSAVAQYAKRLGLADA